MIEEGTFPPQKKYGNPSKWWATQIEYFLLFQSWDEGGYQKPHKIFKYQTIN